MLNSKSVNFDFDVLKWSVASTSSILASSGNWKTVTGLCVLGITTRHYAFLCKSLSIQVLVTALLAHVKTMELVLT